MVAGLGHELRTPLGAALLLAEMAEAELDEGSAEKALLRLRKIRAAGAEMVAVLDAVREITQVALGRRPPRLAEVRGGELAAAVTARVGGSAVAVAEGFDELVCETDVVWVARVAEILAGVARRGGEAVGLELGLCQAGGLRLLVRDSGALLAEAAVAGLFEPFAPGHARTSRQVGGTGCELMLARSMAERLGGSLDYRVDGGANTFVFELAAPGTGAA